MDLIYSLAAAGEMCDHKWILLTSQELEQRLGWTGGSAWSMRGCERCLEVEVDKPYFKGRWMPLEHPIDASFGLTSISRSYWNGIRLFRGGRNV